MSVRDVVVVGAGLAGSALATRLAASGLDVLVLERDALPRDKLCGEFLSPDALSCLEALPDSDVLDRLEALGPPPLRTFRLTAPGGPTLERALPRPAIGVSRRQLDGALQAAAWAAGASVADRCRVVDVRVRPGSGAPTFEVEAEVEGRRRHVEQARAVVDAAGRSAAFRRAPRADRAPAHVGFKRHHVPVGPSLPADLEGAVEIHAFAGGYCGVAEVEDGRVNACLLARADALRAAGGRPERLLAEAGRENEALGRRLDGLRGVGDSFLATADVRFDRVGPHPEGILECGDAAATIAPLAGDGMGIALRSAEIAALHLAPYLAGDQSWADTVASHARAWTREHARRLRTARRIQSLLMRPAGARLAIRIARAAPAVVDVAVRATRDWRRVERDAERAGGPA